MYSIYRLFIPLHIYENQIIIYICVTPTSLSGMQVLITKKNYVKTQFEFFLFSNENIAMFFAQSFYTPKPQEHWVTNIQLLAEQLKLSHA